MNKTDKLRLFLMFTVLILFSVFGAGNVETDASQSSDAQIRDGSMLPISTFTLASSGSEWISVNSYSATYQEWNSRIGSSPYLDAQDHPTNYLWENKDELMDEGWFGFPDTTGTGTLTVNVSIWGFSDDTDDGVIVFVDKTGAGSGVEAGTLIMDQNTGSYKTLALGTMTVSEVNLCRIFLRTTNTLMDDIEIDHMRLGVSWSSAGEDYIKDLTETVTTSDVMTRSVDYDRVYTEAVSSVDVITTAADFARILVESIGAVGVLTMLRGREKDLFEAITASDVRTFSIDYARDMFEAVSCSDVWSKTFGLNRSESISSVDAGTFSKFISKNMSEVIGVADSVVRSVGYSRELTENITATDIRTVSIDYVRNLIEAITVSDVRDIVKGNGTDYEKNLTESISAVNILATEGGLEGINILNDLFFRTDIGGLIGPFALLVVGFYLMSNKKYKPLGGLWLIVEFVVLAQYFTLLESDVAYWWHIIILSLGVVVSIFQSLR